MFYFLHELDLVLHNVRDYHLPLEKISLDILIEFYFNKKLRCETQSYNLN
jgi:hypothetical protein